MLSKFLLASAEYIVSEVSSVNKSDFVDKCDTEVPYPSSVLLCIIFQGGHKPRKPGILRDFSGHGKLMEFSGNSVQPQGKLTFCSGCSLYQPSHMQASVSDAGKLSIGAIWDDRLLLLVSMWNDP